MIRLASSRGEENGNLSFAQEVAEKSQVHFGRCYQCLTCSAGCPIAFAMDYTPSQVMRMVQLGLKEAVLSSSTIWLCASCEMCAARCPRDIDIVRMMDTLRELALREGRIGENNIAKFHAAFLACVRSQGRVHELSAIVRYMLASGDIFKMGRLFDYVALGLKVLGKGKLALFPSKTKGREEVKRIFQRTEQFRG